MLLFGIVLIIKGTSDINFMGLIGIPVRMLLCHPCCGFREEWRFTQLAETNHIKNNIYV